MWAEIGDLEICHLYILRFPFTLETWRAMFLWVALKVLHKELLLYSGFLFPSVLAEINRRQQSVNLAHQTPDLKKKGWGYREGSIWH